MRRRTGPTEGGGGAAARSNENGMSWLHGEPARDDRGRVVETLSVRAIHAANVGKAPAAPAESRAAADAQSGIRQAHAGEMRS